MYCRNCGQNVAEQAVMCVACGVPPRNGTKFCQNCGSETNPAAEICIKCGVRLAVGRSQDISSKSRLTTTLLAFFLGYFGIHRFYLGQVGLGILMLLTFGGCGIWAFIDFIIAACGSMRDKEGKTVTDWEINPNSFSPPPPPASQDPPSGPGRFPRWILYALIFVATGVLLLFIILVIGGFVVGSGGFGSGSVTKTGSSNEHVDGIGVQQEIMATRDHITEGKTVEYNTIPPTSGNHWPQPSKCGFFVDGLPDERVVHNLEHSNIVISYNFSSESEVGELKDVLKGIGLNNTLGVTRYYDQIEQGTLAIAAWGILDTIQGIDEDRIKKFFETYAGNLGPEGNITCLNYGVMP